MIAFKALLEHYYVPQILIEAGMQTTNTRRFKGCHIKQDSSNLLLGELPPMYKSFIFGNDREPTVGVVDRLRSPIFQEQVSVVRQDHLFQFTRLRDPVAICIFERHNFISTSTNEGRHMIKLSVPVS